MSLLSTSARSGAARRFHPSSPPSPCRTPPSPPQRSFKTLLVGSHCARSTTSEKLTRSQRLSPLELRRLSSTSSDLYDTATMATSTSSSSSSLHSLLGLALVAASTTAAVVSCEKNNEIRSSHDSPSNEPSPSMLASSVMLVDPRAGIMYPHDKPTTIIPDPMASNGARSKSYDLSIRAIRGQRQYMEDTYSVREGGKFAAVFDGHGGAGVSSYLRDSLYELAIQALQRKQWEESDQENSISPDSPPPSAASLEESGGVNASVSAHVSALRKAFSDAEKHVLDEPRWHAQGSTAVAVWVHEKRSAEGTQRTLVSANVGDSRAVLSRQGEAIDLTRDHKPNEEREKTRILRQGESIEWDGLAKVHRVKSLSLSRAIGDAFAKPVVSPEVDIKLFPVMEGKDEFLVLASDGLWDVMESDQVVSYVHDRMKAEMADFCENSGGNVGPSDVENFRLVLRSGMSRSLAREALRRGSGDNVCVLIVWLK